MSTTASKDWTWFQNFILLGVPPHQSALRNSLKTHTEHRHKQYAIKGIISYIEYIPGVGPEKPWSKDLKNEESRIQASIAPSIEPPG